MKSKNIQQIRQEYTQNSLDESDVDPSPFTQFGSWFDEALDSELAEPNAMTLSTADKSGQSHSRIVLLKDFDDNGFVFYTNQASDKGQEIASNPKVSLCFFWMELERQVRIEGVATKIPRETAEEYFVTRPYTSQIGALASDQSAVVPNREFLDTKFEELMNAYPEGNVPMPETWGGYNVSPTYFEFWQGRRSRLHDRIAYKMQDGDWQIQRLSP